MSAEILKNAIRPPFANYDLVVYFGIGIFIIPLFLFYIAAPLGIVFPTLQIGIDNPFLKGLFSSLLFLFVSYFLGHIVSYMSEKFIQGSFDAVLGKTSSAILISVRYKDASDKKHVKDTIKNRFRYLFNKNSRFSSSIRSLFHIPVIILYLFIYWAGIFGFYTTRITPPILKIVRAKIKKLNVCPSGVTIKSPWYKPLEHYVINNHPDAIPRLYNYLIISGLLRSLSFLLLIAIWIELYYTLHFCLSGHEITALFHSKLGFFWDKLISLSLLYLFYLFSILAFLKFQRRYVEEAIFCFALKV